MFIFTPQGGTDHVASSQLRLFCTNLVQNNRMKLGSIIQVCVYLDEVTKNKRLLVISFASNEHLLSRRILFFFFDTEAVIFFETKQQRFYFRAWQFYRSSSIFLTSGTDVDVSSQLMLMVLAVCCSRCATACMPLLSQFLTMHINSCTGGDHVAFLTWHHRW